MLNTDQLIINLKSENEALQQTLQESIKNAVNLKAFCIRLQGEFEKVHTQLIEKDRDLETMRSTLDIAVQREE